MTKHEDDDILSIRMQTLSYLESSHFQIPTSSIYELMDQLDIWILSGVCGGMVCGRSRVGKSSAIEYAIHSIHEKYGDAFPVILWSLNEHIANTKDKTFYAGILDAMGINIDFKMNVTAHQLKIKVINYIAVMASGTPYRKAVLFIDEAYKLDNKEYYWLMDLYNQLRAKHHVTLMVFMFGTPREMHAVRDAFSADRQVQIVERFLINEHSFKGIRSLKELSFCLASLDRVEVSTMSQRYKGQTLSQFFFPEAYAQDAACFFDLASEYWEAFVKVKSAAGISSRDIPMHYFMQSFILCLTLFGTGSREKTYFMTGKHIEEAIERTGYGRTADE